MTLMTCSSASSAAPPLLILMVTKQPAEAVKVHRARVSQYLQRNLKAILLWFSASSSTCLQHSSNYNNHHDRRQLPITFPLLILFTRVTFNLISPSSSGYLCCAQTPSQCGNLLDEQNLSHSGGSTVLPLLPDMVINSIPFHSHSTKRSAFAGLLLVLCLCVAKTFLLHFLFRLHCECIRHQPISIHSFSIATNLEGNPSIDSSYMVIGTTLQS